MTTKSSYHIALNTDARMANGYLVQEWMLTDGIKLKRLGFEIEYANNRIKLQFNHKADATEIEVIRASMKKLIGYGFSNYIVEETINGIARKLSAPLSF